MNGQRDQTHSAADTLASQHRHTRHDQQDHYACPFALKPTIPYRAWQIEKIEPHAVRVAEELSRDGMFRGLLGHNFRVFVRVERDRKCVVYSFRSVDDDATDEVESGSTRLR